ncbi:MAG: hypothetical protein M3Q69_17190 [Acidobacteriota bacterium]|nr:hypothetical protein [Acidobacteriota bacterium]
MSARGGKKSKNLAALLNPLIQREIATIGAIDTAMPREKHPGYVTLLRSAKLGKQASVEQMATMIRVSGGQPVQSGPPIEPMLKLQTALMRRIGTTPMLRAMRLAQAELVRAYADAFDELEGSMQKGLQKCWNRARKHLTVLTAHIAKRGAKLELEEMLQLPMTLDFYFVHEEARVCMRCLFDRPGNFPPLERDDPHPYTYICAGCHQEVLSDLTPDLLDGLARMEDRDRHNHVIERALGRASKLKAELLVLNKMSGLAPELPPKPMPYKEAQDVAPRRRAPAQPKPKLELGEVAETLEEQVYVEALFDYSSVRANW